MLNFEDGSGDNKRTVTTTKVTIDGQFFQVARSSSRLWIEEWDNYSITLLHSPRLRMSNCAAEKVRGLSINMQ